MSEILITEKTFATVPLFAKREFKRKFPKSYQRVSVAAAKITPPPKKKLPPQRVKIFKTYNYNFDYHVTEYYRYLCGMQAKELSRLRVKDVKRSMSVMTAVRLLKSNCEKLTGISWSDVCSGKRAREYVIARQVVCFLISKYTPASLTQTGRVINRDHTTVLHSINSVKRWIGLTRKEQVKSGKHYGIVLDALEPILKQGLK